MGSISRAGFARVEAKATGRPGYAPGDLLKLYIYGYGVVTRTKFGPREDWKSQLKFRLR